MSISQKIEDFYESNEKYLFLNIDESEHDLVRELVKSYFKPRLIARTKYVAKYVEFKCHECNEWNDINSGTLLPGGYIDLPGDYSLRCKGCNERIYFCNEYDSLADYKDWGDIRYRKYEPTNEIVIIKEPFVYPREYYNESYCKRNRKHK